MPSTFLYNYLTRHECSLARTLTCTTPTFCISKHMQNSHMSYLSKQIGVERVTYIVRHCLYSIHAFLRAHLRWLCHGPQDVQAARAQMNGDVYTYLQPVYSRVDFLYANVCHWTLGTVNERWSWNLSFVASCPHTAPSLRHFVQGIAKILTCKPQQCRFADLKWVEKVRRTRCNNVPIFQKVLLGSVRIC